MTMTENSNGRIRINVSQSVKGVETVEFTIEVGDATDEEMCNRKEMAWFTVDRMREERDSREWSKGSG